MFKNDFDINNVNGGKLIKTVRGAMKKALFYLGAKVPYENIDNLAIASSSNIEKFLISKDEKIKKLIQLDAKIRYCDDILDNKLAKQSPRPINKMKEIINQFNEQVPEAKEVAKLFRSELELLNNNMDKKKLKEKITNLIEIRPSDFFILVNMAVELFSTSLSDKDYKTAVNFYQEFQRLRDLFDDIMSIEEDILKADYNSIVIAKKNGISYRFFEEIIDTKFLRLHKLSDKLNQHPHANIFNETIKFWVDEYELLFKKLLIDYYVDIDEFRKSYFMIKQL